jgi:hypothetical protein
VPDLGGFERRQPRLVLVHLRVLALVPVDLDQGLLARDLAGPVMRLLGRAQVTLLALAGIGRVVAAERREVAITQLPDAVDRGVEEGAVVRSHEEAPVAA